ncbi:hypothetical protein A176_006226 [Myxococcus hansupus]|uniref:VWA domain-containing protein n=1 Tax=Pseudomyxococcus hansupus TaxID=1297742 RepID=A0A0H4X2C9_9BACT|nr:VIT domain-containing protein [Myxococcus hansupus]AKQ69314.1 hypothetical protein A176_006226 [Myxococcus hansupus]
MTHEQAGLYTKHGAQVPLQGVEVTGELLGGHARVRVRQRYRNDEKRPVEAVYVFPLPSDGTLSAFSMTCAGRRVEGVVKEREEAFRTYDNAITDGHGAALLDEERRNVFTAQVGNLLPGEETVVEVEFLQAVTAEEGSVRWMLPTLVAPRYIPGKPTGDRTAHGREEPTSQVPDADRITPPVGAVSYGLRMDLLVDLGREVVVESPSHAITVTREEGSRVRVGFSRGEVSLDRDLVLSLRSPDNSAVFTPLVTHRKGGDGPGTFALTVVPDLLGMASAPPKQEVVFAVDVSGSMDGESLPQAQAALRLCLRHLREGDRFNIIAFESGFTTFQPQPVPFSQRTLEQADQWVAALRPLGGTELLAPMKAAVQAVPDGVVVLLTDGQVGNESEILQAVLADRKSARVYSFGIGTNVSDVLLRDMAKQTGGAVEFIHPGERIDDKVVAQFSRALAPRVSELEVRFDGVECSELAPAELPPLIDGVPWTLLGRYAAPGTGTVTLRGRSGREPFSLTVRVDLPSVSDRPAVEKLWAAERIRSWESAQLTGRRAESMKQRIIDLAVAHQIVTQYTSFVVVEERTGERRTSEQAETRVVPVNAPAGWAMFGAQKAEDMRNASVGGSSQGMPAPGAASAGPQRPAIRMRRTAAAPGAAAPPPPPAPAYRSAPAPKEFEAVERDRLEMREQSKSSKKKGGFLSGIFNGASAPEPMPADGFAEEESVMSHGAVPAADALDHDDAILEGAPSVASESHASAEDLLRRQLANGLWDGSGAGSEPVRQARATALALLTLLREGITSNHPLHGAQVKKAVEALLALASNLGGDAEVAELALGVAWLASAGPRTRGRIEQAAQPLAGLSGRLGNEVALREHVDTLAAR